VLLQTVMPGRDEVASPESITTRRRVGYIGRSVAL